MEVELVFPAPVAARAVRWEVVYQRMDSAMAELFGVDPAADEVIVAEGVVGVPDSRRVASSPTKGAPGPKEKARTTAPAATGRDP